MRGCKELKQEYWNHATEGEVGGRSSRDPRSTYIHICIIYNNIVSLSVYIYITYGHIHADIGTNTETDMEIIR